MSKRECVSIIILLAVSLFLMACGKGVEITVNQTNIPNITDSITIINETGFEKPDNTTSEIIEYICGNDICDTSESCNLCPLDCGYCKVEFKGNYSLEDIQKIIKKQVGKDTTFRRVTDENNTDADFYIAETRKLKQIAEFKDVKYVLKKDQRLVVLSKIVSEPAYIQNTKLLMDFVNNSKYFLIDRPIKKERLEYEDRFLENKAVLDYPTNPTGYDDKYENWTLTNYTEYENIILDNITIEGGTVWNSFASITDYNVTYKFVSLYIKKDNEIMYDYATVTEKRANFIHSISFPCSPNLVITIYDHSFGVEDEMTEESIKKKHDDMIKPLRWDMASIRHECKELVEMGFIPNNK